MAFPKVKPGDSYNPSARLHNALIDALAYVDSLRKTGGAALDGPAALTWILCQNASGSDRTTNEILGLDAPPISPTDNPNEFRHRPTIDGTTPAKASHWGRFGILLAPAKSAACARLALAGVVPVQLDVGHASHTHADVTDGDATKLTSGFFGAAQILWKESGTGTKWAIVRLGLPFVGPVRGVSDATIAKGATTGVVSVYLDGTTDTGANLTSVNNPWDDVDASKKVAVSVTGAGVLTLTAREC